MATTTLAHRLMRNDSELTYTDGDLTITLAYAGEGRCGAYLPADEADTPLLRLYASKLVNGTWQDMPDGSACTALAADDDPDALQAAARYIHTQVRACLDDGRSLRKTVGLLSWMSAADTVAIEVAA